MRRVTNLRRPIQRWSEADKAKLAELWRAGASIEAIARRLERTKRAIVAMADRLRDDEGVDLPLRNPAGAVPKDEGWITRRGCKPVVL